MNKVIPIFGMMSANLFFVLSSIIGYEYQGIEESQVYIVYVIIVALLNIYLFVKYIFLENSQLNKRELLAIFFPFIILALFLGEVYLSSSFNSTATTYFLYFLIWTVPSIYAAIYIKKQNLLKDIIKWFEVLMLALSLSVIITSILPLMQGTSFTSMGGATYQSASYMAALAYGLNLYFLFYGNNHNRFKVFKSKLYYIICLLLIFVQFLGIFISGGRGGIILFSIYTLFLVYSIFKSRKVGKIGGLSIIGSVFVVSILLALPNLLENELFYNGYMRTLEFISLDTGLNWEGSSNRDIVYINALDLIRDNPLLGYGLYGFWNVSGYPHNILLEVLLNGGLIYLIFVAIFFVAIINKLFRMIRWDEENRILMILFIYPLTMLMFSGTYMINTELWFILTFVFIYNKNNKNS